jgi:hypothetical protein
MEYFHTVTTFHCVMTGHKVNWWDVSPATACSPASSLPGEANNLLAAEVMNMWALYFLSLFVFIA